ncbi:ABC transporter substrate-binding protein [Halomonas sp. McH1-25]|uniref:ABC transporter substrate-binding protein n=1 Tax=unclassified Halomonas TaxID=2609666 RepID=UPI001EF574B6|nr:ABC transporter substrate-binding protein [Halomonas sp. McH1-25]MCP1342050.1 ABC transporter substrate-binding protein [Halomonas sp. FL8]MCP1359902.1 ABC transporter substrate-binding protein [Halomonas sp. BBD45]MCP1366479.1 ABC transporter substrate-binding protein [Halomonas sp. BBD48]
MTVEISQPVHSRSVLAALVITPLLVLLLVSVTLPSRADEAPDVATLDWTLAETLLALGVVPEGVAQIDAYRDWVREPDIPDAVPDLGLRTQPNLELLASLGLDRILISPMFANLEPRLSRIAPVTTIGIYGPDSDPWQSMLEATRQVADVVDRPQAAERLIESTAAYLDETRERLPENVPPLLLVQFMDARHVRVFGESGLYQAVLDHLGLDNAWPGPTNYWGFSLVGLEELAELDAQLIVIEPLPVGVDDELASSGLWRNLRAVRDRPVIYLPPVWSFGALPSAKRFADLLATALQEMPAPSDGDKTDV